MDEIIVAGEATDDRMVAAVSLIVTKLLKMRRRGRWRETHEVRRGAGVTREKILKVIHFDHKQFQLSVG